MRLGFQQVGRLLPGVLVAAWLALAPGLARAQSTGDPQPTREQVELPRPEQGATPQGTVRVDSAGALDAAPCPLRAYTAQVTIKRLRFTGLNGDELAPEIRRLLAGVDAPGVGARPIAVVCDIRDEANSRLRRAGYVASVQIPPQAVETGELRLEVITARIVEVRVRGDAPPYRGTLTERAEQLKRLTPLNERDAERILLIAGDIPGLDVQLALRPAGTVPGEVIGELNVQYRPYSLLFNVNNMGSRQLGRETAYARAEFYGLTGAADVTYVGGSTTFDFREQRVAQIGHAMAIGNGGTGLEASFLHAWSRPDVGALDLRSEALIGSVALSVPFARTRRLATGVSLGAELIEQRTRVHSGGGDSTPLNRDKLRIAFLRAEAAFRGFNARGFEAYSIGGAIELRQGLNILDATQAGKIEDGYLPSRPNGRADAFVVQGELDAAVPIGPRFSLAGRFRGQWTNDPLLNFEEFSIGNLTIGRGYDPGANSADRAIGLRGEARARVYQTDRARLDAFAFYDSVSIWNLDPNDLENDRTLDSYGAGLRGLLTGIGLVEAIYARPRDRALLLPDARRAPDRFLLSLTVQFPAGGR